MPGFDIVQAAAGGGQAILRGGGQLISTVGGTFQAGISQIGGGIAQLGTMVQGAILGKPISEQQPEVKAAAAGYPGGMKAMQIDIEYARQQALAKAGPLGMLSTVIPGAEQLLYGGAEQSYLQQYLAQKGVAEPGKGGTANIPAVLRAAETQRTVGTVMDVALTVALIFGAGGVHQELTKAARVGERAGVTGFFTEKPTRIFGKTFDIRTGTELAVERPITRAGLTSLDFSIQTKLGGPLQAEMKSQRIMGRSFSELSTFERNRLLQIMEKQEIKVVERIAIAPKPKVIEAPATKVAMAKEKQLTKRQLVMIGVIAADLGVTTAVLLKSYLAPTIIQNVINETTTITPPSTTITNINVPRIPLPGFPAPPTGGGGGGRPLQIERLGYYNELKRAYANIFGEQLAPQWRRSVL